MEHYRNYPRIVGETGGKDFIVAHPSADVDALATAIVRGSFEYQGQKCSASSRVYAPSNLWPKLRDRLQEEVATIRMGDVSDFRNFMGAVIDGSSFETQSAAIDEAKADKETNIVVGGGCSDTHGWFVEPTVIETRNPEFRTMREELFGPVVTTYVYDEDKWDDTLRLIDRTAPYGLTGAVFSEDRAAIDDAKQKLRYAAGNFYVNDKPTGAVVGPAAVRRRTRVRHERQGRLDVEPDSLGEPEVDQGDVHAAARLPLPVHGGRETRKP